MGSEQYTVSEAPPHSQVVLVLEHGLQSIPCLNPSCQAGYKCAWLVYSRSQPLGSLSWGKPGRWAHSSHNMHLETRGDCAPLVLPGPTGQSKLESGKGKRAALPVPGCPPYLQASPSAPLSGISRHSSLSMAHCCPAAQHVSIRSFVDTGVEGQHRQGHHSRGGTWFQDVQRCRWCCLDPHSQGR